MTDSYLPDTRRGGQVSSYSDSRPASPFTAAGRLERRTRREADEISARTYLDVVRTEADTTRGVVKTAGETHVGLAKVQGALVLENEALVGIAALGNRVSAELAHSSALSQQLCSEMLVGTSGRVTRVLESGMRRIENA